jgi:hypoxanthine phosphoribosyltransferase
MWASYRGGAIRPPVATIEVIMSYSEKRLVFSASDIARQVARLAREISSDYEGSTLLLVGVLKGAFVFLADLARQLTVPAQVDFVRLASYGAGTTSSGNIRITTNVEADLYQRDVIIIEDIVDTGLTTAFLYEQLLAHKPRSLKICALLDKRERRAVTVPLDYVGLRLDKGFVVGYGLDCNEDGRQHPHIYELVS